MPIDGKDFSGFDEASMDDKLKLIYRMLVHVESELDGVKKKTSLMAQNMVLRSD